jgi:EmrB/QacA subfamily drug resistance transporter
MPDSVAENSRPLLREREMAASLEEAGHPRRWLTLPVLLIGAFLLPLDFSIVNVALPSIRESLGASGGEMQLVIAFYAVTYAVFLVTGGRLGDLFGRKAMFIGGMAGFMLASAACGLAPSIHMLIAGRLVQGLAASVMAPQVLATIRVIFPPGERSRAIGYYGATIGLAVVLGQLCGGLLIWLQPFGYTWQAIFLVNLPVGALDLVLAALLLPGSERSRGVRLDLPGVAVLSVGLVLLVYPLVAGRENGWPAWTLACLALSVPVLALFVLIEHRMGQRGGSPLLNIGLFRERAFSVGLALALLVYASSAFFFAFAVYLQTGLGWNVMEAGLGILPYGLGFFFGSLAVSFLIRHLGHGAPMLGYGGGIVGNGAMIFILLQGGGPGIAMYAALACAGLGLGVVFPSLIRIVLNDISPAHAGMAAGALSTAIQIGPAVAVPLIGGVFFTVLGDGASVGAYQYAFAAVLICIVATFVVSLGLTKLLHPAK